MRNTISHFIRFYWHCWGSVCRGNGGQCLKKAEVLLKERGFCVQGTFWEQRVYQKNDVRIVLHSTYLRASLLTGDLADQYDVYYRTYVENRGWMDWVKNGETSGTIGKNARIEAIQIQPVKKGDAAP